MEAVCMDTFVSINRNFNSPLTITPILRQQTPLSLPESKLEEKQPDLTFHCMCCDDFFVKPYNLYVHMNTNHSDLVDTSDGVDVQEQEIGDELDYSWVLEPVCELVDLGEEQDTVEESGSDSDSDDDNDSTSTSSSSSSTSTTSTETTNTNSITQDSTLFHYQVNENSKELKNMDAHSRSKTKENAAYKEVKSETPVDNNTFSLLTATKFELKIADPHESTSIILLGSGIDYSEESISLSKNYGRKSAALVSASSDHKCFQCTYCEVSFPNAGDLSKHVRSHITNKPFQCSICEKTFTHIGSLNTHIRIHSGEKPYKCELCTKAFTQSSSLMVHMRSHSVRKPFQCHLCDKGFVNSNSLILHLKSHDNTESYICPDCKKEFRHESMLDEHMRMHTQQLVYQCSICRTGFRSSSELVQHMKCHMGEKPFTCNICERAFTQSGSLNIHMRIHTGEKPYNCKLCDKSFTQASSLSVHMKIHCTEKPFPCSTCGKSYSQQAYLNKHVQVCQRILPSLKANYCKSEESLLCIVCGAIHTNASSLAQHVTQKHAALLDNIKDAQKQILGKDMNEERPRVLEQQYIQQFEHMMQIQQQQQEVLHNAYNFHRSIWRTHTLSFKGGNNCERQSEGLYEQDNNDHFHDEDYGAEEEVQTGNS